MSGLVPVDKKYTTKVGWLVGRGILKRAGRNNTGKICVYHRGGGVGSFYRCIEFKYHRINSYGVLLGIMKCAKRSAKISLVGYRDGVFMYGLPWDKARLGSLTGSVFTKQKQKSVGLSSFVGLLNSGSKVYLVELKPCGGGLLARSAGVSSEIRRTVVRNGFFFTCLRMPSKKLTFVLANCSCTVGRVGSVYHRFLKRIKAGTSRLLGYRPRTRGVAMNPIDHPHGGGEGKSSGGRISVSKWGQLTKGKKTLSIKKRRVRLLIHKRYQK